MIVEHLQDSGRKFGAMALALQVPCFVAFLVTEHMRLSYQPFKSSFVQHVGQLSLLGLTLSVLFAILGWIKDEEKELSIFLTLFPWLAFFVLSIGY